MTAEQKLDRDHRRLIIAVAVVGGIIVGALSLGSIIIARDVASNQSRIEGVYDQAVMDLRKSDYESCLVRQRLKAELILLGGSPRRLPLVGCASFLTGQLPKPLLAKAQRDYARRYRAAGADATLPSR